METYVISLPSATDRRETLADRLSKGGIYDFNVWDAISPSTINEYDIYSLTHREWWRDPRLKNERKNLSRKCCYLSHMKLLEYLISRGVNEALVLEDDISFDTDITEMLYNQPKDSLITFLDTTHIEGNPVEDATWIGDYLLLRDSGVRAWCSGCMYISDVKKVFFNISCNKPKVYDKCLIDYIQKDFKTYLLYKSMCIQDRKTFASSIA